MLGSSLREFHHLLAFNKIIQLVALLLLLFIQVSHFVLERLLLQHLIEGVGLYSVGNQLL